MRKLKLQVDELQVESFATARPKDEDGTVRAHDDSTNLACPGLTGEIGCTDWCANTQFTCLTCAGCGGTAVMSCRASDCTNEN
jgi:hypothetical protein